MIETCKICGEEVKNGRHFSAKHALSQKEYYLRYYSKNDLYDATPIVFKDRDSYLSAEFNSKTNMAAWLNSADKQEAEQFLIRAFKYRISEKKLVFAPCNVELKTTESLPSLISIERVVLDYRNFCENLGLKIRFPISRISPQPLVQNLKIAIDTREQKALNFKNQSITKLNFGDYTIIGEGFVNVFIDRKNPSDFLGTFSKGVDRFSRELKRAEDFGAYIVVLVEKPLSYLRGFNKTYLGKFTQASPKYIFSNVRKLLQQFQNLQFLFVETEESAKYCYKVLSMGEIAKNVDLQYQYERGWL